MCPIYVFRCSKCGKSFDHLMSIKDGDKMTGVKSDCPFCYEKDTITKVPACASFKINGYSEANGYNKKSTNRK